ncbi:ATP-grasp domain-containing protein [Desulfurococcaceae archaeon MEX13E-LK6-19]|nr:ATP-grasp domain-containing protein [Desulfurococcaceae archaeon MEX13E-LK6-19]
MGKRWRILIANRGEIAIRIARTVKELGHIPLGIYTSIDKKSFHRHFMSEDYEVSSYLNIKDIIKAAEELGADAIHPGYGFLSENPEFAKKVRDKGFIFIGPSPEAMELAGDKAMAKKKAEEADVPTLPWAIVKDPEDLRDFARTHGYPVLLKAVAGGGGMGIRIIRSGDDIESLFEQAQKEAENAFGDKRLYVEKYLENPKHIEVQILSDGDKVVHLFERDCSVQRRHQKLLEEAPAPILTNKERMNITEDAVKLMRYIGYTNAGTVEMLFDVKTRKHYFMEINARLQVEHPVTEMITGIDIVAKQIEIALEGSLDLKQDNIRINGHAIEARVNAENPLTMLPSPGTIVDYIEPNGPGIRVDSGVNKGSFIPPEYNPLIAKVIAWGSNREQALKRLERALLEFTITGVETNILLLRKIIQHPVFRKGIHTTKFIEYYGKSITDSILEEEKIHAIAMAIVTMNSTNGFRSALSSITSINNSILHSHRVQALKRRAWAYWTMLRSRVKRRK